MWQVILGGAIALGGVLVAEWLARRRDRLDKIRMATAGVAFALPILTAYYSEHPDSPRPENDYSGHFWTLRERLFTMLGELRFLPRWPMRNAVAIRENATTLATMLAAAQIRYYNGQPLTVREQAAISFHDELHSLVFQAEPSNDQLRDYVADGFPMPVDEEEEER